VSFPDRTAIDASARLLDVQADALERFVETYRLGDGYIGPQFSLSYAEASRITGVAQATLRQRVRSGYYVEGRDYIRKGPRTVRLSRRIIGMEREK